MATQVLLFNNCAASHNAARVHADTCPLVAAARKSRHRVAVIEGDLTADIADLNERQFPVKFCKCLKAARP
jgi:hypothetical protein